MQGYKCQSGPHNFVIGDQPSNKSTELKPNASVLSDALGKASFRFLAQLFDVSATTTYNWLRPAAESLDQPVREEKMKEIEIDQKWHFFEVKKTKMDPQRLGASYRATYGLGCGQA